MPRQSPSIQITPENIIQETPSMTASTKPRVLISDALSPAAVEIFKTRGVEVDFQPELGKDKDRLAEIIGQYDGLAIRSATKVTPKILERAERLKVIGRAGIGVDNVDIPAATARGVIVMNTPFGNSITTAEHAIAMMFALARQIPQADASTQAGKWEKNRFMGVEITAKTLGLIGCGNIGSIVADRAVGLRMHVIAYDPFLSPERAAQLGVEKVELDDLLARADIITLHTPLTDKTRNILSADALAQTKKGVRIVNCARGGLVDEVALREALDSGHVAGAAFDVFVEEPAKENPLFGHPNVVCTPHLGAATTEAQENVALQVAEQMSNYLISGAIENAVNFPSITAEEAPRLKPFVALAEKLGSFVGQLTEAPIKGIRIEYEGEVAGMNTRALTSAAVTGALRPFLQDINMVSAPMVARDRGIVIEEVKRDNAMRDYDSFIRITIDAEDMARHAGGTVFQDGKPRVIEIRDIVVDAEFAPHMIYVRNADKPGFIGSFGSLLGDAGVNIATFSLGRDKPGGDAICFVSVDQPVSNEILDRIEALPQVKRARAVNF
jgi:D-3-phosphoglycerate dehydrogenase